MTKTLEEKIELYLERKKVEKVRGKHLLSMWKIETKRYSRE